MADPSVTPVFDVIAEPMRRQILDLLRDGERSVGELVDALPISQPGVSRHLRILRDAGVVYARVDAQRRWYGVEAESLRGVEEWLAPYRRLWSTRLDALDRHLTDDTDRPEA